MLDNRRRGHHTPSKPLTWTARRLEKITANACGRSATRRKRKVFFIGNEWGLEDYWRHTHRSAGRIDRKAHPLTGSQKRNSLSSQPKPTKLKEQSQPLCPEQSSMERRTQKGMRQSSPREKWKEKQAQPESHNANRRKRKQKVPRDEHSHENDTMETK